MSNLNYTTYVSQLANLMVVQTTDPNFITFLPGCIDYAEQRIYRELDLLYVQTVDATTQVSSGSRFFSLPLPAGGGGPFIVVDDINIITPANTGSSVGTRSPVTQVSREFVDATYPSGQTATGVPEFFAMQSNTEVIFGPSPDAAYYAEVVGVIRPESLSASNSSTILTQYVPDLFMAASMVFATGYQRNFGAQGDDPKSAQSWEGQYQTLFKSAQVEQARAKFEGQGWTSQQPSPLVSR